MQAFDPRSPGGDDGLFAAEVNLWNDVGRTHKKRFSTGGRGQRGFFFDYETIVRVQNIGTTDVPRYGAVQISDLILKPADNEDDALGEITFKVQRPTAAGTAKTRWAIALQPCAANDICYALVDGIVWAKINLTSTSHTSVDVAGDSYILPSSTGGSSQIVWVNGMPGTGTATGEQWAVIRISGGGASVTLPTGQYTGDVYGMQSDNQAGWGPVRAHGLR